jgi:hypothetical protein
MRRVDVSDLEWIRIVSGDERSGVEISGESRDELR